MPCQHKLADGHFFNTVACPGLLERGGRGRNFLFLGGGISLSYSRL